MPRYEPKSAAKIASHHSVGTAQAGVMPKPHPRLPMSGRNASAPTNLRRLTRETRSASNASRRFSSPRVSRLSGRCARCSGRSRRSRRRRRRATNGGYRSQGLRPVRGPYPLGLPSLALGVSSSSVCAGSSCSLSVSSVSASALSTGTSVAGRSSVSPTSGDGVSD